MTEIAYEPVSLGDTCAVKFHICRKLHDIIYPGKSELSFRLKLVPPHFGERQFGKHLFDWQGTSIDSVSESMERDFQGLFERADMDITAKGVFNRSVGTNLTHYFDRAVYKGDLMPEEVLDKHYPPARSQYDRMCREFREHLKRPGPFLYIHRCREFPDQAQVERLIRALTARNPDHKFHLLFVGVEEFDQDYSSFGGLVGKAYRTDDHGKPKGREWEENDAEWDKALAPFTLAVPANLMALATPAPAQAPTPPVEAPRPKGLLSLFSKKR